MTIKVLVLGDRPNEYSGKKGLVKQQILDLMDAEVGVNRLITPLEYAMSEEEKLKYAGKLQDKIITIGVRKVEEFGGAMRIARGQIVSVETK